MLIRLKPAFYCNYMAFILFYLFLLFLAPIHSSEILRPRGVPISKSSLYVPNSDFVCLDGSGTFGFHQVNDDYCDCKDGSDEPGTSACPNGSFHCTNPGHRPIDIPSSRVNDGVCDCCDTSDEYASQAKCINDCKELGKAARLKAQKQAEQNKIGVEIKQQFIKKGKQIKQEKAERLNQLEKEKEEAETLKQEKENIKNQIEEFENKALEKYRKIEEEQKKQQQEEEHKANEKEAFEHFHLVDTNQDGKLQISEIQAKLEFDQNKDGVVTEEEVKFFMESQEEIPWENFLVEAWPRMKPFLMLDKGVFTAPEQQEEEETENTQQHEDEAENRYEAEDSELEEEHDVPEDAEDEEEEIDEGHPGEAHPIEEEEKPKYDEQTEKIIQDANKARNEFTEADRAHKDIMREMSQIKESLEKDYGPHEEFASLEGECFEYSDNEYVYKLCPFDQATQRSKSGGSETRLGAWGRWVGPENNKYQAMLYDRGQSCWNGPQRSVQVKLLCSAEVAITSVSEPNKCEYYFEFATPSVCSAETESNQSHDEL